MWRDLSTSAVAPAVGSYQQFSQSGQYTRTNSSSPPPAQFHKSNSNLLMINGGGGQKYNVPGQQRSSSSLPHPAHAQSNMRWQQYDQFPNSRTLAHSPSFQHIPNNSANVGSASSQMRQRPASMYDTPQSNLSYLPSFMVPNKPKNHQQQLQQLPNTRHGYQMQYNNPPPTSANNKGRMPSLRQGPGELVRHLPKI